MTAKHYIIGISGASASGKTYLLHAIRQIFSPQQVCIISQDNYYHPIEKQAKDEKGEINFDLPEAINMDSFLADIQSLLSGFEIQRTEYTFNNPSSSPAIIKLFPSPVIIAEGLFLFYFDAIKRLLDLKVFIECDQKIQLERRLQRDHSERGLAKEMILYQWEYHVLPCFNKYLMPYKAEADLVITNNKGFEDGMDILLNHINRVLYKNE